MIDFKQEIISVLNEKIDDLTEQSINKLIETPKDTSMGDYAFPCFALAKIFRKAPNMIAKEVAAFFEGNDTFESVEPVNAYVNFKLNKAKFAQSVLQEANALESDYGKSELGNDKNIIVEFSSTNIAKPFHMGHIRSTMIGNSLYRIYKFLGYNTVGINHLGDYGTQFGKLIVAYKLWGDKEAIEANPIPELLKIYVKFHEVAKEKPELEDEARAWFTKLENGNQEAFDLWKWFKEVSLKEFKRVYNMLGVEFDSYAGESFYSDKIPAILQELRDKNVMEDSDGAEVVNLEAYDMPNALITKSDGSSLYITRDLAAAKYRKEHYDFDKNIYVVGSQQNLHFQQWMKIIELMGYEWAKDCIHVDFGLVGLEEGSLSTRNGRVVFLEDVLNKAVEKTLEIINDKNPNLDDKEEVAKQVGVGAVVFQELSNNRIKDYTFSWDQTLAFEGETGPYVQYTHTRASSLLRKSDLDYKSDINYSLLSTKDEMDVIRLISKFKSVVIDASEKYEPSLITRYIIKVAQSFNRFYHNNQIITDNEELTKARLHLVNAVKYTLKNGLYLISLEAPEKM